MSQLPPDALDRAILANVEQYGWHVQAVFPTADAPGPEWAYTIGVFQSFHHPELAISGIPLEDAHRLLNKVVEDVRTGQPVAVEQEYDGLFEGDIRCRWFEVDTRWYAHYFGRALDFYGSTDFPILQAVWSDTAGHYPWDEPVDPSRTWPQFFLFGPDAFERSTGLKAPRRK